MRRSLPILLTLLLVAIVGCSEKKEKIVYEELHFPIDQEVELEMVIEDPLWPAYVGDFDIYNGKLVLLYDLRDLGGKLIHFYDAESGEELKHTVRKGRGPGEMLGALYMDLNREDGTLSLFDYQSRELYQANVDSLFHDKAMLTPIGDNFGPVSRVFPLPNGYLTFGTPYLKEPEKRYTLIKNSGEKIIYTEYPCDNYHIVRKIYLQHRIGFSKERTRMVAVAHPGLILEFFDLTDGIEERGRRYYKKLIIEEDGKRADYYNSTYGIVDLYTSDNYIYTTYGEANGDLSFSNIAIFDWEGNPIKILRTKYKRLHNICVDSEEKFLYLISRQEDGTHFLLKLDLTTL